MSNETSIYCHKHQEEAAVCDKGLLKKVNWAVIRVDQKNSKFAAWEEPTKHDSHQDK